MRFLAVISLSLVGIALGSPIGQEVTTVLPSELRAESVDATTLVVEVFADEAVTGTSVTERARQGEAAGGEDEDNEEDEATTVASGTGLRRPTQPPAIAAPLANTSNFLAEYQYSSQFELGPKEGVPLVDNSAAVQPPAPQVVNSGAPQAANPSSVAPLAAQQPPALPGNAPVAPAAQSGGDDEDDAESEEGDATQAPTVRLQQVQQQVQQASAVEAQRVEESDSDNEITNDDVTTVKTFISEYEYTVSKLGGGGERV